MKIWLVQTGEILPLKGDTKKMRIALLAEKLAERGHSVLWWTSAFDHVKKEWIFQGDTLLELKSGIKIQALKGLGYKSNVSLARYLDHRILACRFKHVAAKMPMPDIILTSTPPYDLACAVVSFAKSSRIPVIVDIRDEWPDFFLTIVPAKLRTIFKSILFREFKMIRKALRHADALTSMVTPLLNWGLKYAGRHQTSLDRVFYLGHNRMEKQEKGCHLLELGGDRFVVTFLGTITQNNNPSILIKVAEKLKDNDKITFVIAGAGELFEELKEKSVSLPNVIMPGWLNPKEMANLLQKSHVGVCSTPEWRSAFPNKAFAYLAAGLPIVMPFQGDLKELAEKYHFGFYYAPNDANTLMDHIQRLAGDSALQQRMANNSQKIFERLFESDKIYKEFAQYIESVAASGCQRRG